MEKADGRQGGVVQASEASVQNTIRHLNDELIELLRQRTTLMQRISSARRTIVGLAELFGVRVLDEDLCKLVGIRPLERGRGLTDMCRHVLMEAGRGLTVQDVREGVCLLNPELLAGHQNPLASLNTILNRLVRSGQARQVQLINKKWGWQWAVDTNKPSPVSTTTLPDSSSRANTELEQTSSLSDLVSPKPR